MSKPSALMPNDKPAINLPGLSCEVRGLKKSFGLKPILRGLDLALPAGQRMALLGANGTGKTTLLRILAGLTRQNAGTVSIEGLDNEHYAQQSRHLLGFVAHQPYLYEDLTALENLLFFARMYTVPQAQDRARDLLLRVGLDRRAHERVSTFSRGQVQRLSWARALLHAPRLLLLDEADTGLDQQGRELIDALQVEHVAHGGSILFTTHQLERALALSDKIVLLAHGRATYQTDTTSLSLDALQQRYREVTQ